MLLPANRRIVRTDGRVTRGAFRNYRVNRTVGLICHPARTLCQIRRALCGIQRALRQGRALREQRGGTGGVPARTFRRVDIRAIRRTQRANRLELLWAVRGLLRTFRRVIRRAGGEARRIGADRRILLRAVRGLQRTLGREAGALGRGGVTLRRR